MRGTSREKERSAGSGMARSATTRQKTSGSEAPKKAKATPKGLTETVLARVETVRLAQRQEGSFDCFATARQGYCDQDQCLYRNECLDYSQRVR